MLAYNEVHVNNISFSQSTEFTFPDIVKPKHRYSHDENEYPFGFSPPLWSKNVRSDYARPRSPAVAMAEGRKELMEMTDDLPESCYELSLRDIVAEDSDDFGLTMGEMVDTKPKAKAKKKGPISRSVSLDTGVFLLKMFIPMSSFGLKKHKQTSRSMSTDGSRKYPVDVKQYWKTWLFVENNNTVSSRLSDNNKDRSTTVKIRYGRYWFTSKSTNQKGCIFF